MYARIAPIRVFRLYSIRSPTGGTTVGVMSVTTHVRPEDLAVVAEARGYDLVMDQSKKNGGREDTMKPMEVVLAALGGCISMVARGQAPLKGIDLQDIGLAIEGDYAADGFRSIRIRAEVASSSSKEEVEKFLHFVENICPVSNSLKATIGIEVVMRPNNIRD